MSNKLKGDMYMSNKTGYCPVCQQHFEFNIDGYFGYCPKCAHSLVLNDAQKKYNVVTLCGSTKFKDEFIRIQKELTLAGNVVISVGLFGHSGDNEVWTEGTKQMLDDMHKQKIDMADEIFVINVGGYIGESTQNEIKYAISQGKVVKYLE